MLNLSEMANAVRLLAADAVEHARSGHPGMAMGIADVITALFVRCLRFDPRNPLWTGRDRLIFSAGHGVMALYAVMYLAGYPEPTLEDIKRFRQMHSKTPGHPEFGCTLGVESTTGPLGQGLANAVGIAIASKKLGSEHRSFVIAGDGCMMEGISHEAAALAGHLGLNNLIVFYDSNDITIDGATNLAMSDNVRGRFSSYGWRTILVDGHNFTDIFAAIDEALTSGEPTLIECKTTIAKGAHLKAGSNKAHGSHLGEEEIAKTRINLNWPHEPFVVPDHVLAMWRSLGCESVSDEQLLSSHATEFSTIKELILSEKKSESTRASSGKVIEHVIQNLPHCIGGSADLTESNCVRGSRMSNFTKDNPGGNFIHYGVREHAMGAIMNGLSLSGLVPYGGTFLVFSDYMRPAIRLSAIMGRQVIYVMTHDSIGVGEDGPTHQPVEHLASLRAIPDLLVFRPANAIETAEAWEVAMSTKNTTSILALTRQNIPFLPEYEQAVGKTKFGAYLVSEDCRHPDITILATGSELVVALEAAVILRKSFKVRVVSMPCWRLFEKQSAEYKERLIDKKSYKVAIEAAVRLGWDRYIGSSGLFIGIDDGFGLSAPADKLFEHFGITAKQVADSVIAGCLCR